MCQVHFVALFLVSDEQSQNAESGDGGGDGDLSQGATESLNDTKGTFPRLRIISFSHFGLSNSSLDVRFLALFLVSDEQSQNAEGEFGNLSQRPREEATESSNNSQGTFRLLECHPYYLHIPITFELCMSIFIFRNGDGPFLRYRFCCESRRRNKSRQFKQ